MNFIEEIKEDWRIADNKEKVEMIGIIAILLGIAIAVITVVIGSFFLHPILGIFAFCGVLVTGGIILVKAND